ncbi:MAG: PaaI family thioesterase [Deltaproteobacteria bacterium]|nr:PaaI family thioesterase [Deltaproteobacteria bacterium]MBW2076613.1 PaaI family thioesterase [Deltaproteobacteria bacterium]MBW2310253.1 PaaI family thioesterase [Deltaproteobacteria bacterium]
MAEQRVHIPKLEGYSCFACGTANPIGLNLSFYRQEDYICSDVTLGKNYEGWENMAHGGIASTVLDEIMSWAMIYFKRTFFVTRSMRVKYLKPVPLCTPLTAKGRIEAEQRRLCRAKGFIQDGDQKILTRAEATFAVLSDEDLIMVPEGLKAEMSDLFALFKAMD